jgi:hypothetical protein
VRVKILPLVLLLVTALGPRSLPSANAAQNDLDAFMSRVLARRDENWKKMQQYILEERERLQVNGPDGSRVYGFDREYTWFIRDGFFVRSPLKFDGVTISDGEPGWSARRLASGAPRNA